MNESLISIIGILMGIIGTLSFSKFNTKYSFGFTGNIIIGVFGAVFFTKLVSRFGINPFKIVANNVFSLKLFLVYLLISLIGGIIALILLKKVTKNIKFG